MSAAPSRGRPEDVDPARRDKGYQAGDVAARPVLYALAALFAGLAVAVVAMAGFLAFYEATAVRPAPPRLAAVPIVPPGPRLEVSPTASRVAVETEAGALLAGTAPGGPGGRHVRMPIERAMAILARRGWPGGGESERKAP